MLTSTFAQIIICSSSVLFMFVPGGTVIHVIGGTVIHVARGPTASVRDLFVRHQSFNAFAARCGQSGENRVKTLSLKTAALVPGWGALCVWIVHCISASLID
jgi:hypothetical protein